MGKKCIIYYVIFILVKMKFLQMQHLWFTEKGEEKWEKESWDCPFEEMSDLGRKPANHFSANEQFFGVLCFVSKSLPKSTIHIHWLYWVKTSW